MRPRPNSSGHGERPSSHRSGSDVAECLELAPIALKLLALRFDDLGWCVRDETLVRQHSLRAADLLAQPLLLRLDGCTVGRGAPLRLDDGVEDPLTVDLELDAIDGA